MSLSGSVLSVYRWPVKSMAGEILSTASFDELGMVGDRAASVEAVDHDTDDAPVILTARNHRWLLRWWAGFGDVPFPTEPTLPVVTGPDGIAMRPDDPSLIRALEQAAGFPIALRSDPGRHPDVPGVVHLTLEASRRGLEHELGIKVDIRRFRPNLHLDAAVNAFGEGAWIGKTITFAGGLALEIVSSTQRCAIPTNEPMTGVRSPELLRRLRRSHDLLFGVYARVINPARIDSGARFEVS